MARRLLSLFLLFGGPLIAQTTTITINDSNGSQTFGTIRDGNVFFHDSNGNLAFGTIRDGNVFLNTDKGEITFGTIKNGNVFLTDQQGVTTGTIRNGNILLNNSDGSTTIGTYNPHGFYTTTTNGVSSNGTAKSDDESKRIQQQNYEAGYAVGQAVGTAVISSVAGAINVHRKHKYCKDHPNGKWNYDDGSSVTCASINAKREARVYAASSEVDSQFRSNADEAYGLMEDFRHDLMDFQSKYADAPEAPSLIQQSRSNWLELRKIFCGYYQSGTYTDLEGKVQTCNGRPGQSGSTSETTGDNPTAADLACQSKRPGQYVKIGGKKSMCYYGIDDKMHASR